MTPSHGLPVHGDVWHSQHFRMLFSEVQLFAAEDQNKTWLAMALRECYTVVQKARYQPDLGSWGKGRQNKHLALVLTTDRRSPDRYIRANDRLCYCEARRHLGSGQSGPWTSVNTWPFRAHNKALSLVNYKLTYSHKRKNTISSAAAFSFIKC